MDIVHYVNTNTLLTCTYDSRLLYTIQLNQTIVYIHDIVRKGQTLNIHIQPAHEINAR